MMFIHSAKWYLIQNKSLCKVETWTLFKGQIFLMGWGEGLVLRWIFGLFATQERVIQEKSLSCE